MSGDAEMLEARNNPEFAELCLRLGREISFQRPGLVMAVLNHESSRLELSAGFDPPAWRYALVRLAVRASVRGCAGRGQHVVLLKVAQDWHAWAGVVYKLLSFLNTTCEDWEEATRMLPDMIGQEVRGPQRPEVVAWWRHRRLISSEAAEQLLRGHGPEADEAAGC